MSVLHLEGPLHAALGVQLRQRVEALLHRGEARIVLCLARVSTADAAGIGELVRAHNRAAALNGLLRITNATENVRAVLDRVGLFDLLSRDRQSPARRDPRRE
jgi:anti-anti-sigma factor